MRTRFRKDLSGKAKGKQTFVMITHQVFDSPAFRHLDCHGRALYLELRSRYNGHNNGRIGFSARDAAAALNISKSASARTFDQLVDHLLIERQGGGVLVGRLASEWTLTEVRNDVTGQPPSKAFLRWSPGSPSAPKKHKHVPPVGSHVPPTGRNGSPIPQDMPQRPTHGTQQAEKPVSASHGLDTYRYLPVHSAAQPAPEVCTGAEPAGAVAPHNASKPAGGSPAPVPSPSLLNSRIMRQVRHG
jgi:hypothetical protein